MSIPKISISKGTDYVTAAKNAHKQWVNEFNTISRRAFKKPAKSNNGFRIVNAETLKKIPK